MGTACRNVRDISYSRRRRAYELATMATFVGRRRRSRVSTRVRALVVAQNRLMFDYVKLLWEVAATLAPVEGYASVPSELIADARQRGLTPLPRITALTRAFDVILLADHAPSQFDPYAKRIRMRHGAVRSRPVRGGNYVYDVTRLFWHDGRPVYDLMLDVSEVAVSEAVRLLPEYEGRIVATGDLRTARLFHNAQTARLGSPPRVAIMSTWGPHGLVERHADWLFPVVRSLALEGIARFCVSVHPNIWAGRRTSRDWRPELVALGQTPGVHVAPPTEDWTESFADCAIAISDHTSLSGSFSVLDRPILPVQVHDDQIGQGSFFQCLLQHVPPVDVGSDLGGRLRDLIENGMPGEWSSIRRIYVPDPDDVRERTASALAPFFLRTTEQG